MEYLTKWSILVSLDFPGPQFTSLKLRGYLQKKFVPRSHPQPGTILELEYLGEFETEIEKILGSVSGAQEELIYEKNHKSKISWYCPFKSTF